MAYRVGVDVGGTFTDFCAFDERTNEIHTLKVLSTPDKPGAEVLEGIAALRDRYGVAPESITYFTHGTTAVGQCDCVEHAPLRSAAPLAASTGCRPRRRRLPAGSPPVRPSHRGPASGCRFAPSGSRRRRV